MGSQGDVECGPGAEEPETEAKQPKRNHDGMTDEMVAVVGMGWSVEELQEVVSNAECSVIHGGGRADDHEPPRIDMGVGEVHNINCAVAALDLGATPTHGAQDGASF